MPVKTKDDKDTAETPGQQFERVKKLLGIVGAPKGRDLAEINRYIAAENKHKEMYGTKDNAPLSSIADINAANKRAWTKDESSWVAVTSVQYQSMQVGKSYRFDGRIGKVVEKAENSGQKSAAGLTSGMQMVRVSWR